MKTALALLLGLASPSAHAQSPSAEAIALNCLSCHDATGVTQDDAIPGLARFDQRELTQILLDFKYGYRSATLMPRLVKGYSDDELAAVARFLAER